MDVPDIDALLGEIPWAVVSASATRLYMPERRTDDLDVLVAAADGPAARKRLLAAGAQRTGGLAIGGTSWRLPGGPSLDLLEGTDGWVEQALREAMTNRDGAGLRVLPLPYLTVMKLCAGRVQDIADITRMLGQASEAVLASVREVVVRFEPDAAEDIDSMVVLGRLELGDA